MLYNNLPSTDIKVSRICLGTMNMGKQNNEAEGHEQMDYALEQGVNFFDTAELYAIPIEKETQGKTEEIIGTWLKKTGNRDKIVLASKIVGPPSVNKHYIRETGYSKDSFEQALHSSLKRLQTDYLDLYQLHWPDRMTNFFGKRGYKHADAAEWEDNINEILHILDGYVKQGKIKHIGLSNDVSWSTMRYLEEAKYNNLPRIVSVQNPYNLLNRLYEESLAEISIRENVGCLPYSPLGFGRLSNKFIEGHDVSKARIILFSNMARYNSENCLKATQMYYDLARENGMSLATMALAFINQQPFVTSNIIGATTMEQLKENIDSINVTLSDEVLESINEIHNLIPNPAP